MMEMCIELQDLDGVVYREFRFKFGMQDTLDHLNGVIESTWNIAQKYQELFSEDGRKLIGFGEDSLQSLGLKHRSKVIFRHARLGTWSEYLAPSEQSLLIKQSHVQKALEDSGFLIVYASFWSTVERYYQSNDEIRGQNAKCVKAKRYNIFFPEVSQR
ncbi:unnamed protein product [Caenorhabditis auriculariae]|uniref:Uncharacterized protein n=1 Tax=Caenorhabditis auriculariae TaxID=2777116 RepID=A0A8S1H257_9PELO|nr:unnamed protein product [Caenorhabditis auriculariae]